MNAILIADREHLCRAIQEHIDIYGTHCDLNHFDVSQVTDMSWAFKDVDFQGDISKWDTRNVQNMYMMFAESSFNGDISKWDVSNVENMTGMFLGSFFQGDLSNWSTMSLTQTDYMFANSQFQGDLSQWNMSRVVSMNSMFEHSKFSGDISGWDVSNVESMSGLFLNSLFQGDLSSWNFSNLGFGQRAFDKYHPSVLGYIGVLSQEYEVPTTAANQHAIKKWMAIAESLGMDPIKGALLVQQGVQGMLEEPNERLVDIHSTSGMF